MQQTESNTMKYKYKVGDEVSIIAGDDKGKKGKILHIDKKKSRVYVEGIRMRKKSTVQQETGKREYVDVEAPIHYSNIGPVKGKKK